MNTSRQGIKNTFQKYNAADFLGSRGHMTIFNYS